MYIKINEYREVDKVGISGLKEENKATILHFEFPDLLREYNKYVEFETEEGKVFDVLVNQTYELKNNITKFGAVKAQIVAKKEDVVWRSNQFSLKFGESINANTQISEEKIDGFNTLVDTLKVEINEVESLQQEIKNIITDIEKRLENHEFQGETGEGVILRRKDRTSSWEEFRCRL